VVLGIVIAVGLIVLVGAWLGIRGWMAKGELESVAALQPRLTAAIADGDAAALLAITDDVAAHAGNAAGLTSDPLWRATEAVPGVGANTAAVRVLSESVRDIAVAAHPVLDAVVGSGDAAHGLDLSALAKLSAPLSSLAEAVVHADGSLSTIPADQLVGPVRDATVRVRDAVGSAAPHASDAVAAARALPGMLGLAGPRTLLVMVQNPAELRTGGGITGSFIAVRADGGRLQVQDRVDSGAFPKRSESITSLPADLVALYGDAPGRFVMNATMTPDFAVSAQLATAWWTSLGHDAPDAVIAVDPYVLAALLTITGPLTLSDGTVVNSADMVDDILVRPYLDLTAEQQTALQRDLTDRLFARLTEQDVDPIQWLRALATPAAQGRISVWSSHPDEERMLAGPLGGAMARFRAAGPDAVGVYFNDATTGKMDTYLHTTIAPAVRSCRADGATDVEVSITLRSSAPASARTFSAWMTGGANPSAPGDITTDVTVMVPSGWFFGGVESDAVAVASTDVDTGEFPASLARVILAPGEERTLTFHFVAKTGTQVTPSIVHTPTMNEPAVEPTAHPACA